MDFIAPKNYKELLEILDSNHDAKIIAGGTDLMVKLHKGLIKKPPLIIDISRLKELCTIEAHPDYVEISSAVTFTQIIESPIIKKHFPALIDASSMVGAVQIQNKATLGGNICNASPAADSLPVLMALNSRVVLESTGGQRTMDLEQFIVSRGSTSLGRGEVLKSIQIPIPYKDQHCSFEKLGPRRALAISILSLCVNLSIENNIITGISIYSGCLGPKCTKEHEAENALLGRPYNSQTLKNAIDIFGKSVCQRLKQRKSGVYKSMAASGLLQKCLNRCLENHQWQREGKQ